MGFALKNLLLLTVLFPLAKIETMPFSVICLIYLLGMLILAVEMLVPGAFLGVVGVAIVIGSIVLAFWHHPENPFYGISLIFIALIVLPAMAIWMLRRITLVSSQNLEDGFTSADETLEKLLGKSGITITALRPSGIAKIENRRVDVTAENVMLAKETPIEVVKINGNRVVVKAIGSAPQEED